MIVTLKDVARAANVSEATVSLALNDSNIVNKETRKRVKRIAQELGYSPNAIAQGLAKRRSRVIGLIVPDIENLYYGKLVRCIDEKVREAGYGFVLAISNDKPAVEEQIISNFVSQRVEGLIVAPVNHSNEKPDYYNQPKKHGIPFVFVTAYYPALDSSYVMVDLEEGSYKLVKYLLDMGHRNILFLTGSPLVITASYRINGYIRAFKEKNLDFSDSNFIECRKLNYEYAYDITMKMLKDDRNMDAIITVNDSMALGVVNALRESGVRIPEEISVAGYDNMIFSSVSPVPITTVNQDIELMSWHALNIIMDMINDRNVSEEKIFIKPELIIRNSTGGKQEN